MTIGRSNKAGSETRVSVSWNVERAPNSGRNCFGRTSREAGHSRVPAPPHMISGIIRLSIGSSNLSPSTTPGPLYPSRRGCRNTKLSAIARSAPKPYQGGRNPTRGRRIAYFFALLKLTSRGRHASDPAFDDKNTDLRRAALSRAAQGQSLRACVAHQYCEPRLDRHGDCRDLPADFCRRVALARDQRRVRRAAGDKAGDALQFDRNILQPDPAILDRRRRRKTLAGRARRRRVARGDLFHLRRPRHRPDRACDHHRCKPAMELQPYQRSSWPVGAAVRRLRGARGRRGISRSRPVALALAEALVGHAPYARLL